MRVNSETEMLNFGREFAKKLTLPAVIELIGDVGVGKTTFTRGLASGLGITTPITSPSFTISKRYSFPLPSAEGLSGELVHYDFYRLDDPGIMRNELAEALLDPNSVLVVEWGGDVADLLPSTKHRLEFSLNTDGSREISLSGPLRLEDLRLDQKVAAPVTSQDLWKTGGKLVEKDAKVVQKPPKTCGNHAKNSANRPDHGVKLYLDTSTDTCILRLGDQEFQRVGKYDLAEKIFSFIHDKLQTTGHDWADISEITFFSGPGSFTGLRIGAALVNTLAHELKIPLYDHHGQQHQIILPAYGREANISAPRK